MNRFENMTKIKTPSLDEMFGLDDELGMSILVKVDKLVPYHTNGENPFSMERNENFEDLIESIKEDGVRTPVTVRVDPDDDMKYEIISGHRRTAAAKELGIEKIPAVVLELDDDEAQKSLTLSNKHREGIKASEKARAYKMYLEAKTRQRGRKKNNCGPGDHNLKASESVAEELGIGEKTVRRYAKLTELIPALMNKIDNEELSVKAGEQLAHINEEGQSLVESIITDNKISLSIDEATELKNLYKAGGLNEDNVKVALSIEGKRSDLTSGPGDPKSRSSESITDESETRENKTIAKPKFNLKEFTKHMPDEIQKKTPTERHDYIVDALIFYNNYRRDVERENEAETI